jgi:hypothetical protein
VLLGDISVVRYRIERSDQTEMLFTDKHLMNVWNSNKLNVVVSELKISVLLIPQGLLIENFYRKNKYKYEGSYTVSHLVWHNNIGE